MSRALCRPSIVAPMMAVFGCLSFAVAQANSELTLELWVEGVRQQVNSPQMLAEAPIVLVTEQGYKIELAASSANDAYSPSDILWLTVVLYTLGAASDEWIFLTDALLGARLREKQVFSVAGEQRDVTQKNARVYLEITARRQ